MKIKINVKFLVFFFILITDLACAGLFSQEDVQKTKRQVALDAYTNGDYAAAYADFADLLKTYPKDPLYKYYSGASLVKLGRDPGEAVTLLQEAVKGSTGIKNVPDDVLFYLGRSQQMSGMFKEAINSFNLFSEKAGKKISRDYQSDKYIEECMGGKGVITKADYVSDENNEKVISAGKPQEAEPSAEIVKTGQPVVKPVQVREATPEQYDRLLSEAMDYQVKADSLSALAFEKKLGYNNVPSSQKPSVKAQITELETLSLKYQKLADEKSAGNVSISGVQEDKNLQQKGTARSDTSSQNIKSPVTDNSITNKRTVQLPSNVTPKASGANSLFEMVVNPGPAVNNRKVPIDPVVPKGLVYRIQVAVFSKPVTYGIFKGISPVSGFTSTGTQAIKYYAGMFRETTDANKALQEVKKAGFRDAFLAAVFDGKPVSLDRALLLEKEWGQKPLTEAENIPDTVSDLAQNPTSASIENDPATLTFRVEVTRTKKPLKEEAVEPYRKMAGKRSFEILTSQDGVSVYLIGKFITFASASEYADLLRRNGYTEARVAAYLGNTEIPVDKAKQLFEELE